MRVHAAFLPFALVAFAHAQEARIEGVTHLDAQQAARLIAEDRAVRVLDVRTPAEYGNGHIAGAELIDFLAPGFEERVAMLDRDDAYLVHCRSGNRSTRAIRVLKDQGFTRIYHLDGGMIAWRDAGLPVAGDTKEATP